jgi:hypothetical protein
MPILEIVEPYTIWGTGIIFSRKNLPVVSPYIFNELTCCSRIFVLKKSFQYIQHQQGTAEFFSTIFPWKIRLKNHTKSRCCALCKQSNHNSLNCAPIERESTENQTFCWLEHHKNGTTIHLCRCILDNYCKHSHWAWPYYQCTSFSILLFCKLKANISLLT